MLPCHWGRLKALIGIGTGGMYRGRSVVPPEHPSDAVAAPSIPPTPKTFQVPQSTHDPTIHHRHRTGNHDPKIIVSFHKALSADITA